MRLPAPPPPTGGLLPVRLHSPPRVSASPSLRHPPTPETGEPQRPPLPPSPCTTHARSLFHLARRHLPTGRYPSYPVRASNSRLRPVVTKPPGCCAEGNWRARASPRPISGALALSNGGGMLLVPHTGSWTSPDPVARCIVGASDAPRRTYRPRRTARAKRGQWQGP